MNRIFPVRYPYPLGRRLDLMAGRRIDQPHNLADQHSLGVFPGPAGQLLGNRIHKENRTRKIGGDHGITDALERGGKPLIARPQGRFHAFLLDAFFP